jgi:predicted phosphodiesterase
MNPKKINLLVFSDMHDRVSGPINLGRWFKTEKIDLVLCCGDITSAQTPDQISHIKKALEVIKKFNLPFFTISGNNEREEATQYLRQEKVFLEEAKIFGYHLVGISGWGEIIPSLQSPIDQNTILITHVPPHLNGKINLDNAPLLHLHGHVHMPYNKKVLGKTTIISVPPLINGQALKITLPNLKTKVLAS